MAHPLPLFDATEKKEKCGLFGVWGTPQASHLTYQGLFAQQHRGQESAGIAVSNGTDLHGHAAMGLVSQVFSPRRLKEDLAGPAAIGHVRYSTTGSSELCNAQPLLQRYHLGPIALAHNGNLINAGKLRDAYAEGGHIFQSSTDTEVIVHLLADPEHLKRPDPLPYVLRRLQGAFSLLFLFPDRLEAARDPWGVRPLSIGKLPVENRVNVCDSPDAPREEFVWCVASETCAFDVIGAEYVRDVEPGEIIRIDDHGLRSRRFEAPENPGARCVFEFVYFANPASRLFAGVGSQQSPVASEESSAPEDRRLKTGDFHPGRNVHLARERMGRKLADESTPPGGADCVMPMPDSGRSAALGFAKQSGLPFEEGIVPNRFVGRTFILPDQKSRNTAVNLKLNIIGEIVDGKRIVVVDDSIVRGTTTRSKMRALRRAGAREIHLRVSCPPIRHPCHYGIDFATVEELIATGRTVEEIRAFLEIDSLAYLSMQGVIAATGLPESDCCTACWSGVYKIPIDAPQGKYSFERSQLSMFDPTP